MARVQSSANLAIRPGHILSIIGWIAIGLGVLCVLGAGLSSRSAAMIPPSLSASASSNPAAARVVAHIQSQAPWRSLIAAVPMAGVGVALVVLGVLVLQGKPAGRDGLVGLCTLCLFVTVLSFLWRVVALVGSSCLGHAAHITQAFPPLAASLLLGQAQSAALIFFTRAYLLSKDVTEAFKAAKQPPAASSEPPPAT